MKKKSVISGRPKITDHVLRSLCGLSFCPKITVWVIAHTQRFMTSLTVIRIEPTGLKVLSLLSHLMAGPKICNK